MSESPATVGRYQIVRLIAHGGMGSLYLARDPAIDRLIAIKVLKHGFDDEDVRERFTREARATGRLRHPNIVTVFDVGEHDNRPFIAMEYVPGETVEGLIRQRAPLPITQKLAILEDLCSGLHYAHQNGIIHRDVKPANIILDIHGTLKILDFGIARVGEHGTTQTRDLVGTLNYMAPEQITGKPCDHRADMYATGVLAYELLSYQKAFPGTLQDGALFRILHSTPTPLGSLVAGIDPEICEIVDRAMTRNPDDRYQDLEELRANFAAVRGRLAEISPAPPAVLASDAETSLDPVGTGRRTRPPTARQSSAGRTTGAPPRAAGAPWRKAPIVWAAAAVLALAIVVSVILSWRGRSEPTPQEAREVAQAGAPETSPAGATAGSPGTGDQVAERPAIDDQLRSIRAAAREHLAAGRQEEALDAASAGLALDEGDAELHALLDELGTAARETARRTRVAAQRRGASQGSSVDYADAQAQERNAESLQRRGNRAPAIRALWTAAALYERAGRQSAQRQTPPPRDAGMPPRTESPPAAVPDKPEEPRPGPPAGKPAEPLTTLPGSITRPTPPPAPPKADPEPPPPAEAPKDPRAADRNAIHATLSRYADAYRRLDPAAVKQVLPSLSSRQMQSLERDFSNYRSYTVEIDDIQVKLGNSTATVTCSVRRAFETRTGVGSGHTVPTTFHLRKVGSVWIIERLE